MGTEFFCNIFLEVPFPSPFNSVALLTFFSVVPAVIVAVVATAHVRRWRSLPLRALLSRPSFSRSVPSFLVPLVARSVGSSSVDPRCHFKRLCSISLLRVVRAMNIACAYQIEARELLRLLFFIALFRFVILFPFSRASSSHPHAELSPSSVLDGRTATAEGRSALDLKTARLLTSTVKSVLARISSIE